jgi:hypothetical protein
MDNQPAVDRSLLIPILLSGFSVIGIIVVLLIGRTLSAPPEVPMTPSATRFSYVYLGTEPAVSTPLIEDTEVVITDEPVFEEPTEPQGTPPPPVFQTPTRPGPLTPIILPSATVVLRTNTPASPTMTSASGLLLAAGVHDDANLVYSAGWDANNVAGATLHVSTQPGPTLSFQFTGTQLRIGYIGGTSLGEMTVAIDNASEIIDQSGSEGYVEWVWPNSLANITHTVVITHRRGGAVNLDKIIIPPPPTPTPTRTPNL